MQILDIIKKIRNEQELNIIRNNNNPYRILLKENDGIAAYYFSVPIYSERNRQLIEFRWQKVDNKFVFNGINATAEIQGNILTLKNIYGQAMISFDKEVEIEPTFNGGSVSAISSKIVFNILLDKDLPVRGNGKFFAFMRDEYIPFLVINGIYGKVYDKYYPLKVAALKIGVRNYEILIETYNENGVQILFEIDLHSEKFILDTTVESKNPNMNNAFGGVAFLGRTEEYGEQWLYTRFDPMQLTDLKVYQVKRANLYIPKYNASNSLLESYKVSTPWCSFGVTWETKKTLSELIYRARRHEKYEIVGVTDEIKDILRKNESKNTGIVIKGRDARGNTLVSTGDNYLLPQILEIKLKK